MNTSSLLFCSVLLSLLLVPIIIAGAAGFFLLRWENIGRWQEAKRHEFQNPDEDRPMDMVSLYTP